MRGGKKTKIVATIGPASVTQKTLEAMARAGMNVCRLNFSHGEHAWHKKAITNIRKVEKKLNQKIGILADIQGPRIRTANKKPLKIEQGKRIFLTDTKYRNDKSGIKVLPLDWDGFYKFVHIGDIVYIEDGLMRVKILEKVQNGCRGEVLTGGLINTHKGVNIPSISNHLGFLTEKDLNDLEFIVKQGVDFIAASFVSCSKDIKSLRELVLQNLEKGRRVSSKNKLALPWIIAKIERKLAIENIKEIVNSADGIMIARGDLAIEMPQEKVAILQKDIIDLCIKKKKPVIVATQMMASMVTNSRPTRAEISDVTNAVIDSADAIMLSGETATGKYPVSVIDTMAGIVFEAEKSRYNDRPLLSRNKFAQAIFGQLKRPEHEVVALDLADALNFSSLRQEEVLIKVDGRKLKEKGKTTVVWGVS